MADLSQIGESERLPIEIPVRPYLADHRFEGRAVLPAVEAMETLSAAVARIRPGIDVTRMAEIRFEKFLSVPTDAARIDGFVTLSSGKDGGLTATLETRLKLANRSMSRVKTHAAILFSGGGTELPSVPLDVAASIEGLALQVSADDIYRDLVPFGPAYQNLKTPLIVSAAGVLATIRSGPATGSPERSGPLGSPFSLDAAFHGACVWGQRFAGVVAFPVGIDRRTVIRPTRAGETCFARIFPRRASPSLLVFDIWIHDRRGALREVATGVRMRDVSGGRTVPPGWIREGAERRDPVRIARGCRAFSLIELVSMAPFAETTLSPEETGRFLRMGERRRRSFLAARMAMKRIARHLAGGDLATDPRRISTVFRDRPHPRCPRLDDTEAVACSVSHDRRFAVAVASSGRVGVDVEEISDRALRSRELFMTDDECARVVASPLGESAAALRIWSVKEAVAKALDISLADAWQRVEVERVGETGTLLQIDGQNGGTALHDVLDGHLFTLFTHP
jgi:phosphopantetheinyl transferase